MQQKIIFIAFPVLICTYFMYISYSRDFYRINGIPITIFSEKVILGQYYLGFSTPQTDYIILEPYSIGEVIDFHNEKEFDLYTTSSSPIMNLKNYTCLSVYPRNEFCKKSYKREDIFVLIELYWDFGCFWETITYNDFQGQHRTIIHEGFLQTKQGVASI